VTDSNYGCTQTITDWYDQRTVDAVWDYMLRLPPAAANPPAPVPEGQR
jgi:hypothetical protein